jgi:hypothetical protein
MRTFTPPMCSGYHDSDDENNVLRDHPVAMRTNAAVGTE